MKEEALTIAAKGETPGKKLNYLREYLQAFALRSFHESGAFTSLIFTGGTALRFLYNLPRFSEDLDFSIEKKQDYKPEKWLSKLKRDLQFSGFESTLTWESKKTVHKGWIRIAGLLNELGLSAHQNQNISIKLEIDTKPPRGAILETKIINRYFLVGFQNYDLSSLMAGKIHALGCRQYIKGRDWYDLFWYQSQRPPIQPNLKFLQAAIDQTEENSWSANKWKKYLTKKIATIDWKALLDDVVPFLENPQERRFLTKENFLKILHS